MYVVLRKKGVIELKVDDEVAMESTEELEELLDKLERGLETLRKSE